MDSEPTVRIERRGPLALIWLNRPHALNAMTVDMMVALNGAIAEAEGDRDVAAIAITGVGRGFCSGFDAGDLGASTGTAGRRLAERGIDPDMPAQFVQIQSVTKPVIAAVNGPAAGMGFVLAMMCDLRFAGEEAMFMTAFSHRGLIAEHGTSWLLPRIVGESNALDLLWSSRKVRGAEALRIGLADRCVPADDLLALVQDYIEDLAARASPRSIALIKDMVRRHRAMPFAEALVDADRLATESLTHPDASEGIRSLIEKRAPRFGRWP